jgi:hypothetical protein
MGVESQLHQGSEVISRASRLGLELLQRHQTGPGSPTLCVQDRLAGVGRIDLTPLFQKCPIHSHGLKGSTCFKLVGPWTT